MRQIIGWEVESPRQAPSAKSRMTPGKFEFIAVQGQPRSSTLVPIESVWDFLFVNNSNFGRNSFRFPNIDA